MAFSVQYSFGPGETGCRIGAAQRLTSGASAGFIIPDFAEDGEDFYTGTAGWIGDRRAAAPKAYPEMAAVSPASALLPKADEGGVYMVSPYYPLRFGLRLPKPGRYRLSIVLQAGAEGAEGIHLSVGRRNILERNLSLAPGERYERTTVFASYPFRPVVRRDESVWDEILGVSLWGRGARLRAVRVETTEAPVLFIGGDSIVRDYEGIYPYNPITNGGSWGQNLLQYLDGMGVCNQAHSGMTGNCFREDGHWALVEAALQPGDVFMFEFGHNDQKRRNLKAFEQYAANLRWYVQRTRRKGATAVLVSPMSRIPARGEDAYYDLLADYAESVRRVGRELSVPVVDVHSISFERFCALGRERCQDYFVDTTHVNDYGAALIAAEMAEQLHRPEFAPLPLHCRRKRLSEWTPDTALYPPRSTASARIEEHPNLSTELPELPYADCRNLPEEERQLLHRAMSLGLLDPCVRHLHPEAGLPRAQFIYILLKAVKPVRRRAYQGTFCDVYRYEFDAEQIQAALDSALLDDGCVESGRFRPDDGLRLIELCDMVLRARLPFEQRGSVCFAQGLRQAEALGLADMPGMAGLCGSPGHFAGAAAWRPVTRLQALSALVWLREL